MEALGNCPVCALLNPALQSSMVWWRYNDCRPTTREMFQLTPLNVRSHYSARVSARGGVNASRASGVTRASTRQA